MEILTVGAALKDADIRTDWERQRTVMTEVTGAFCDYVNTPKNKILHQLIKRRNNLRAASAMSIELHDNTRC